MKKKYEVIQEEISDCGVACLLSIIRYYGGDASLENLRISSLTTKDGVNAYNLIECAKENGFDAKGLREFDLNKLTLPCVLHINNKFPHFVCLYKIDGNSLTIMDPGYGFKKVDINTFKESYTGNSIILFPIVKLNKDRSSNVVNKKIISEFKNNKKSIIKIILLNFIFICLSIIVSNYIRFLSEYKNIYVILLFLIISLLSIYIDYLIKKMSVILSNTIGKSLLKDFFYYIFRLPLKYIHLKSSGEIIKRVHDMENIKDVLISFIINMIINLFILIFIVLILVLIEIKIIPLILTFIIISSLLTLFIYKDINKEINNTINENTNYESNLVDYLNGITSIIHSNSNEYMFNRLNMYMTDSLDSACNLNKYNMRCEFIKNILSNIFIFLINSILFIDIIEGSLDINNYIIINYMLNIFESSMNTITSYIPSLLYIKNIIRKINEFYLIKKDMLKTKHFTDGDIVIDNMSFSYNKYSTILTNKNIKILKGEKIILKGESGCGKSTLCKILNKEYEYQGSIKINGVELSDININSLRNNITYSSQDEYIFNGTIKDNITLGLEVDESKFNKIAEICLLERIIKNKPFGFDTFLFGGAGNLSGGERNLIILARALIRESKILILDETMKELNDEVENKVLDNIFNYYKDTTIIYVSHKNKKNYFKRCLYV